MKFQVAMMITSYLWWSPIIFALLNLIYKIVINFLFMHFCLDVEQLLHQDTNVYNTSYSTKTTHLLRLTHNFRVVPFTELLHPLEILLKMLTLTAFSEKISCFYGKMKNISITQIFNSRTFHFYMFAYKNKFINVSQSSYQNSLNYYLS